MRISDWSSDVCSSDLVRGVARGVPPVVRRLARSWRALVPAVGPARVGTIDHRTRMRSRRGRYAAAGAEHRDALPVFRRAAGGQISRRRRSAKFERRSELHKYELQSTKRPQIAVFSLKK